MRPVFKTSKMHKEDKNNNIHKELSALKNFIHKDLENGGYLKAVRSVRTQEQTKVIKNLLLIVFVILMITLLLLFAGFLSPVALAVLLSIFSSVIATLTIKLLFPPAQLVSKDYVEVYNDYNQTNKSFFNEQIFHLFEYKDVTLNTLDNKVYFNGVEITDKLLQCKTLEEQLHLIHDLRMHL